MARSHGIFNVAAGLWPLVHRRTFEAAFGQKRDYWLAATVALLLVGNGAVQISAPSTPDGVAYARHVGVATAVVLASVDVVNVRRGRISRTYLIDALAQVGWLWAWGRTTL